MSRQPSSISIAHFESLERGTRIAPQVPPRRPSQTLPNTHQGRMETCKNCSSSFGYERQLLDENKKLKEKYEDLRSVIDSRGRELDEISKKLAQERSLLEVWTKQARGREEDSRRQIEGLKKRNEDMYTRLCKGRRVYVSHDEFRDSLNTWYSAAITFCPKYFPYTEVPSDNATTLLPGEIGRYMTFSEGGEESLFYYERQSRLFDSIIIRASANFLARAHGTLGEQLTALEWATWEQGSGKF